MGVSFSVMEVYFIVLYGNIIFRYEWLIGYIKIVLLKNVVLVYFFLVF